MPMGATVIASGLCALVTLLALCCLLPTSVAVGSCASPVAFVPPSASSARARALFAVNNIERNDITDVDNWGIVSRRRAFRSVGGAIIAASSAFAKPPTAKAGTAVTKPQTSAIVSNTLCDPSVSTWVKKFDDATTRTVHILGTAHISSLSAELAGKMVREIKPNVVFVELDAKRVGRLGGVNAADGNGSIASPVPSIDASDFKGISTSVISKNGQNDDASPKQSNNPFDLQSKLVNVGSKYVGNAVKGMYGKLESEGFKAGDEFAMSVHEGLALGSTIVLGDRDVEVTLQRLTKALAKTDIRKLLDADSDVNKNMEALLPDNLKQQFNSGGETISADGAGGSGDSSMLLDEVAVDRGEFQTFVETMKAKENVKQIMKGLESTAPEIYQAMVAERDVYMASGLDQLNVNLGDKSSDKTVAVMGMAHVDGVERYLASKGWKEMSYPCPAVR